MCKSLRTQRRRPYDCVSGWQAASLRAHVRTHARSYLYGTTRGASLVVVPAQPRHQAHIRTAADFPVSELRPNDATSMAEPYNAEIMRVFGFWTGVLTLKIMAMSLLTARTRFKKKVFANHEDAMMVMKKARVAYDDEDVERVRRAHLNDLENILPWVAITYVYLGTGPANWIASLIIRGFVLSRIGHTMSYAVFPKQPFRAIFFFVGFALTAFEAASTMLHYF